MLALVHDQSARADADSLLAGDLAIVRRWMRSGARVRMSPSGRRLAVWARLYRALDTDVLCRIAASRLGLFYLRAREVIAELIAHGLVTERGGVIVWIPEERRVVGAAPWEVVIWSRVAAAND